MQEFDVRVLAVLEAPNRGPCPVGGYKLVLRRQMAVSRVPSAVLRHLVVINTETSLGGESAVVGWPYRLGLPKAGLRAFAIEPTATVEVLVV
jgi:hypothetical protein